MGRSLANSLIRESIRPRQVELSRQSVPNCETADSVADVTCAHCRFRRDARTQRSDPRPIETMGPRGVVERFLALIGGDHRALNRRAPYVLARSLGSAPIVRTGSAADIRSCRRSGVGDSRAGHVRLSRIDGARLDVWVAWAGCGVMLGGGVGSSSRTPAFLGRTPRGG
jgi:hypothetical protein